MDKVIHLISDLHLCEEQPHLLELFKHYMQTIAPQSDELYVLGDLFEVWVGDDHHTDFNQQVIDLFADYGKQSRQLFFSHGNRDFLLGDDFANACHGKIIPEPHHLRWQDKQISLLHGDSLCTDDVEYQQTRVMIRNADWQNQFLSQTIDARLAFAAGARQQSKASQKEKSLDIMDVNKAAVEDFILLHQCDWLIHGHTHREGRHEINLKNGTTSSRIVLSDWGEQGHYLQLKQSQLTSHYFSLS